MAKKPFKCVMCEVANKIQGTASIEQINARIEAIQECISHMESPWWTDDDIEKAQGKDLIEDLLLMQNYWVDLKLAREKEIAFQQNVMAQAIVEIAANHASTPCKILDNHAPHPDKIDQAIAIAAAEVIAERKEKKLPATENTRLNWVASRKVPYDPGREVSDIPSQGY